MSAEITVPLSSTDQTFCLAVLEYNGNLGAAYRAAYGEDARYPLARAREMIARPEIARYIQKLTEAADEHALISLGAHLSKLAEIRDLAMVGNQFKVALQAETKRGEVAGFYKDKTPNHNGPANPSVVINLGATPVSVHEWASKHGSGPVVDVTPK